MSIFFYTYLFIIGTLFGSFSSVIINRIKNKKNGILTGRSECPKCNHKLGVIDLIPIFSYISIGGKCRYCKEKISSIYPILELTTGLLFFLTGYFLIDINQIFFLNIQEIYKLLFFLLFGFFTIIYVFYDILYLEIPEIILIILICMSFFTVSLQSLNPNFEIIKILVNDINYMNNDIILIITTGIIMIGSFYIIMLKGLKDIYDICIIICVGLLILFIKYYLLIDIEKSSIGSSILGSFFVFIFLYLQIFISNGTWLGGGDLRIGILLGLLTGLHFSFEGILLSYLFGSIIGIGIIIYSKTKNYYKEKKNYLNKVREILGLNTKSIGIDTKMPFGPFLAIGIYLVLFFSEYLNIDKLFFKF